MKQLLFTKISLFTLPLLLLIACGSKTSSEPTLTFHENGCSYSGPATVASQFTLTWIIEDSGHSGYVYALVTLDHGKSVQDLATIPAEDPPPSWVTKLDADRSDLTFSRNQVSDIDHGVGDVMFVQEI